MLAPSLIWFTANYKLVSRANHYSPRDRNRGREQGRASLSEKDGYCRTTDRLSATGHAFLLTSPS
jgi:hypothetical protein